MNKVCAVCESTFITGSTIRLGKNKIFCSKKCANINNSKNVHKFSKIDWFTKFQEKHGSFYDYSLLPQDFNSHTSVDILCPSHGLFVQLVYNHTRHGCPKCKSEKLSFLFSNDEKRKNRNRKNGEKNKITFEKFAERANLIHSEKYIYHKDLFVNKNFKTKITCKDHGDFYQSPRIHLYDKCGCPVCGFKNYKEKEWLDSIGLPDDKNHRQVKIPYNGTYFLVDGFDPEIKTVYEFYGDYWHGNPKVYKPNDVNKNNKLSFGLLYENTITRENLLKQLGFNIITRWETNNI